MGPFRRTFARPLVTVCCAIGLLGAIAVASDDAQADPQRPVISAPPARPKAGAGGAAPAVAPPATAIATATSAPAASATGVPAEHLTLDGLRLRVAERQKTIDQRRQAERDRIRLRWGALVTVPAVHEELRQHAERIALLERIRELAEVEGKAADASRAGRDLFHENARHERQMQALAMTANAARPASTGAQP